MRKNETADMMHYWYMMGVYYSQGYRDYRNGGYPISPPNNLQLGGTPLNHAIVAAMTIIPSFKTKNGIQKVNAVFLTDGVSHRVSRKVSGENLDSWKNDVYITDKQTNTTITSEKKNSRYYSGENQTTILLELLKKRIPESNVLGFFVAGSGSRGIVRREIIQEKMGLSWSDDVTLKKFEVQYAGDDSDGGTNGDGGVYVYYADDVLLDKIRSNLEESVKYEDKESFLASLFLFILLPVLI